MNSDEATKETADPGSFRDSPSKMAASTSGSSVAGLHGGNFYDLTRDENHLEQLGRHRSRGAVMDDGRAYGGTPTSMAITKVNKRPNPKQRNAFIIDLVNDSDGSDADDGVRKKRSLQRNGKIGPSPNSSPLNQKRTRPLQSHMPKCHFNLPPIKTRDGATITFGLLSLIDVLKDRNTLTCEGSTSSSKSKLFAPIKIPSTMTSAVLPFNHQPFHYLQNDNWSCGFRNLQMLISSMMPTLSSVFPEGVPCIQQIQSTMETLWSRGFDRTNADHHKDSLSGKKTWIGTVEVWSYLTFNRIDSIIVQFIKTKENRAMLGSFVWAYFSRICGCGPFGCSCNGNDSRRNPLASPILHSPEYAANLLREISSSSTVRGRDDSTPQCKCSLPPLYLQWEGHSVTVVGIRKNTSANEQSPSFNLIIFCPQKQQLLALKNMLSELTRRDPADISLGSGHSEKFVKSVIELPVSKLQHKDCQILLSTAWTINEAESHRRKSCTKNIGFLDAMAPRK